MNLTCKICNHDFDVDENNLDTEKVDCPQCSWPNLIMRRRNAQGYFGKFVKTKTKSRINLGGRKWPSVNNDND